MKKILTLIAVLTVLFAVSASAQSIFNGYAYLTSNETAGVSSAWYDLSASAQALDFQGSDLGDFESNMWLGGQTGFWSDSQGVEYIKMHYSITGAATASGSISYAFESYTDSNDQWGTDGGTDSSVDLIDAHSLAEGDYSIAVWVEGKANNRDSVWDNNSSSNYTADFTVVPEPATVGMLGLGALLTLLVRRMTTS